jgi:flavodoxin
MKVLVVFDSVFGNTQKVAAAIGEGIEEHAVVEVCEAGAFSLEKLQGLGFLIVGSPTRGFRPTPRIVNLLKNLPEKSLQGVKVVAFDTRILLSDIKSAPLRFIVKTGGYAAKPISKMLTEKGGKLILPPEGFFVAGDQGPLKDGELERATRWITAPLSGSDI